MRINEILEDLFWAIVFLAMIPMRIICIPIWLFRAPDPPRKFYVWRPMIFVSQHESIYKLLWLRTITRHFYLTGSGSETCDSNTVYSFDGRDWN